MRQKIQITENIPLFSVVRKFKGGVVGGSVISVFKLGKWVAEKKNKNLCDLCGSFSFGEVRCGF
jgi:hypothetical protein